MSAILDIPNRKKTISEGVDETGVVAADTDFGDVVKYDGTDWHIGSAGDTGLFGVVKYDPTRDEIDQSDDPVATIRVKGLAVVTASGAVTRGQVVIPANNGEVQAGSNDGTDNPDTMVGKALTAIGGGGGDIIVDLSG